MKNRISNFGILSLAHRAGKVAIGREAVQKMVESGKARVLVIAEDASPKIAQHFSSSLIKVRIPIYYANSKTELGASLGRGEVAVLAICDVNFAKGIIGNKK